MSFFLNKCDDEDDEVEVALVCPVNPLNDANKTRDYGENQLSIEKQGERESEKKVGTWKKIKRKLVSETIQCTVALIILVVMLGLVVLSYFYCQVCLFGIMIISACMCPFISYFNIPLWTSILLIVILGMTYTQRPFTFIWK